MTTRKLKNFEFAGQTLTESSNQKQIHAFDAFDTPNGFVFLVTGSDRVPESTEQICQTAGQRVRYYFENEQIDDPLEAVRNSLVYVNGYLYELARKQPGLGINHTCMLCVLVRDKKVYYSWMGDVFLFYFNGKKINPLITFEKERGLENEYLGSRQFAEPRVCEKAFVPVDHDVLLMASGSSWTEMREKSLLGVLTDNMPTTTKVQKLVKLAGTALPYCHLAAQMISFYNLEDNLRNDPQSKGRNAMPGKRVGKSGKSGWQVSQNVKIMIVILGILALSYMIYDLFLFDPERPLNRDVPTQVEPITEREQPEQPAEIAEPHTPANLPDDVRYSVRRGDTWSRIYQQFEVCSWFIRNHPPNAGKFDNSGNPVFNTVLMIPVMYSGSQTLNPDFYQEFSTEKLGNACQNANEAFLRRFRELTGQ